MAEISCRPASNISWRKNIKYNVRFDRELAKVSVFLKLLIEQLPLNRLHINIYFFPPISAKDFMNLDIDRRIYFSCILHFKTCISILRSFWIGLHSMRIVLENSSTETDRSSREWLARFLRCALDGHQTAGSKMRSFKAVPLLYPVFVSRC